MTINWKKNNIAHHVKFLKCKLFSFKAKGTDLKSTAELNVCPKKTVSLSDYYGNIIVLSTSKNGHFNPYNYALSSSFVCFFISSFITPKMLLLYNLIIYSLDYSISSLFSFLLDLLYSLLPFFLFCLLLLIFLSFSFPFLLLSFCFTFFLF